MNISKELKKNFSNAAITQFLGLELIYAKDGKTRVELPFRKELTQGLGVIHGGIQATLADEAAAWYVYAVLATGGVTRELCIRYHAPARTEDGPFTFRARGTLRDDRTADIQVTLENARAEVCTESRCEYVVFPEPVARKRFGYPGREAFFHERA